MSIDEKHQLCNLTMAMMLPNKTMCVLIMGLLFLCACQKRQAQTDRNNTRTPSVMAFPSQKSRADTVKNNKNLHSKKPVLGMYSFMMLEEDLCVVVEQPASIRLHEQSNWIIMPYHCETAKPYSFDPHFVLKASSGDQSVDAAFYQNSVEDKHVYTAKVHFNQSGQWQIQLALILDGSEQALIFEQRLMVNIESAPEQSNDAVSSDLPDELQFEKIKGLSIQLNWPQDKTLIKDDYYDIAMHLNQPLPDGMSLKITAHMPNMDHKYLDFFIEDVPGDARKKMLLIQLTMLGEWHVKVMIVDSSGAVMDEQNFSYRVLDPEIETVQ